MSNVSQINVGNNTYDIKDATARSNLANKQDIIQKTTLPTASSTEEGNIYQYIGETGNGLTNGYFYKCVENNGVYSWQAIDVQAGGGDISGKADKVSNATAGNFAGLDATGNLTDSGKKASDFEIASTATGTSITLTDSADSNIQAITVKGRSEVVEGEIVSVGDNGFTITTANSDSTAISTATITTGLPYRSVSDSITDELTNIKVITKCGEVDLGDLTWVYSDGGYFQTSDIVDAYPYQPSETPTIICAEYVAFKANNTGITDKGITMFFSETLQTVRTRIIDHRYSDAATFTAAVTGVKLVYPLATPTETPLTSAEKSALASLRTYDSITHIDATDAPTMTVNYLLNTNNGQAVAHIDDKLASKVDKVQGKGLSTEDYTAAEKTKLSGIATGATANTILDATVTIASSDWTGNSAPYTATKSVLNILATDTPIMDLVVSSTVATGLDELEAYAYINRAETSADSITFYCYEDKPTVSLTIQLKVFR